MRTDHKSRKISTQQSKLNKSFAQQDTQKLFKLRIKKSLSQ